MSTDSLDQSPQEPTLVESRNRTSRRPGKWRISNIIDGRALRVKLTAAALDNLGDAQAMRKAALDHLHGAMFRGRTRQRPNVSLLLLRVDTVVG